MLNNLVSFPTLLSLIKNVILSLVHQDTTLLIHSASYHLVVEYSEHKVGLMAKVEKLRGNMTMRLMVHVPFSA